MTVPPLREARGISPKSVISAMTSRCSVKGRSPGPLPQARNVERSDGTRLSGARCSAGNNLKGRYMTYDPNNPNRRDVRVRDDRMSGGMLAAIAVAVVIAVGALLYAM